MLIKQFCFACFWFLLLIFNNFLRVSLPKENTKPILALVIPIGEPIAVVNKIKTHCLLLINQVILVNNQMLESIYQVFVHYISSKIPLTKYLSLYWFY